MISKLQFPTPSRLLFRIFDFGHLYLEFGVSQFPYAQCFLRHVLFSFSHSRHEGNTATLALTFLV